MRITRWILCVGMASCLLLGSQAYSAEQKEAPKKADQPKAAPEKDKAPAEKPQPAVGKEKAPAEKAPAAPAGKANVQVTAPKAEQPSDKPADINPQYFADLANVNLRYNENQKAVDLFQKAIELQGGEKVDPNLAYGLGKAYMNLKQTGKAEAILEMPFATIEPERQAQYVMAVAALYKKAELYAKAEKLLLKAKIDTKSERDQTMIVQQLLELYKSTPLGKDATATFEKRLKDNPKDSEALKGLMDLYLYDSKLEKAAEMAARYSELNPDDVAALRDLAFFYIASADLDKTVDATAKLIEKDPENKGEYYSRIIYIYNEQNKLDKVEEWADKAEKNKVKSDATYEALADSYTKANQPEKALTSYKKAVEANPANNHAKISCGRLLVDMGKGDEAKKLLEPMLAVEEAGTKSQVQELLLRIYQAGEKPKADAGAQPEKKKDAPPAK